MFAAPGLRRSTWFRGVAVALIGGMVLGVGSPALAAASEARARAREPQRSHGLVMGLPASRPMLSSVATALLPRKLAPLDVECVASTGPRHCGDAWAPFDRSAWSLLEARDDKPVRLRVSFGSKVELTGIVLTGPGEGTLDVLGDAGGAPTAIRGLSRLDLSATDQAGRRRFDAQQPTAVEQILLDWRPARAGATLGEIELWGIAPRLAAGANVEMADVLALGLPPGAVETRAEPDELTVSTQTTAGGPASFFVSLDVEPRALQRAFLVYDLEGLSHWASARRRINNLSARGGGADVRAVATAGRQVEEISPAWLKRGDNQVEFLPVGGAEAVSYRVRNLGIVGTMDDGRPAFAAGPKGGGQSALLDGDTASGISANFVGESPVEIPFEGTVDAHAVSFLVDGKPSGTIRIDAVLDSGKTVSAAPAVSAAGLRPGWNTVDLDPKLPPVTGLHLGWRHGQEGGLISEIDVAGSALSGAKGPRLVLSNPVHGECRDGVVQLRGFVTPPLDGGAILQVDGKTIAGGLGLEGAFSADITRTGDAARDGGPIEAKVVVTAGKTTYVRRVIETASCTTSSSGAVARRAPGEPIEDGAAPFGEVVRPDKEAKLSFGDATIEIPAGAVDKPTRITIHPLTERQVKQLNRGMINATQDGKAFRLGPHGLHFAKPVKVTIPYDAHRLPTGLSAKDVTGFFYDEDAGRWVSIFKIAAGGGKYTGITDHFSDYVAGALPLPDHPTADSLGPSTFTDLKVGDPASGLTMIQPPTPGQDGAAHLSFPIELPPGRRGMAPHLAATYSSEAKNGALGWGWDVPIPSIEVDTRFGVPLYDATWESETYLLEGAMLAPTAVRPTYRVQGTDKVPNTSDQRTPDKQFWRRVEGAFDKIIRHGNGPANYYWEVIDKNGTSYTYGASTESRVADPNTSNIFRWYLASVTDTFQNTITYTYDNTSPTMPDQDGGSSTLHAVEVYPKTINYTGSHSTPGYYTVTFEFESRSLPDDSFTTARPGFVVRNSQRLKKIGVSSDGGYEFRSYVFNYRSSRPELYLDKTMLAGVAVYGANGPGVDETIFYHYDFEYFHMAAATCSDGSGGSGAGGGGGSGGGSGSGGSGGGGAGSGGSGSSGTGGGPDAIDWFNAGGAGGDDFPSFPDVDGFGAPSESAGGINEDWGQPDPLYVNGLGEQRHGADPLLGQQSVHFSIAAPICDGLELGGGGGLSQSTSTQSSMLLDVNGDGLPDLAGVDAASIGYSPAGGYVESKAQMYKGGKVGNFGASGTTAQSLQLGITGMFDTSRASSDWSWSWNASDVVTCDFDGDGLVDVVSRDILTSKLNVNYNQTRAGELGFFHPEPHECTLEVPTDGDKTYGDMVARDTRILPLLGWTAPYAGTVRVRGGVARRAEGDPGQVVEVAIHRGAPDVPTQLLWHHSLATGETCVPSGAPSADNTSCGAAPGGLSTFDIVQGQRLYFMIKPGSGPEAAVDWQPLIEYTQACEQFASSPTTKVCFSVDESRRMLKDPNGQYLYYFAPAFQPSGSDTAPIVNDFRLAGRGIMPWIAQAGGRVAVEGNFVKGVTSDEVTLQMHVIRADGLDVLPDDQTIAAYAGAVVWPPGGPAVMDVSPGDQLVFTAVSRVPVDPARLPWRPRIQYQSYCRQTQASGWDGNCSSTSCSGDNCTVPALLGSGAPPSAAELTFHPEVHFPLTGGGLFNDAEGWNRWDNPWVPYRSEGVPGERWGENAVINLPIVPGDETTPVALSMIVTCSSCLGRAHGVIQGISQRFVENDTTGPDDGVAVLLPSRLVVPGEQYFPAVYLDRAEDLGRVQVSVSGAGEGHHGGAEYDGPATIYVRALDPYPMSGGYHGFYAGGWRDRDPDQQPAPASPPVPPVLHDFYEQGIVPPSSFTDGAKMVPPQQSTPDAGIPLAGPVAASRPSPFELAFGAPEPMGSRWGHLADDLAITSAGVMRAAFLGAGSPPGSQQTAGEILRAISRAPALRKTVGQTTSMGLGALAILGSSTSTGSSDEALEFMDINGDGFPDSIKGTGNSTSARLNDGLGCFFPPSAICAGGVACLTGERLRRSTDMLSSLSFAPGSAVSVALSPLAAGGDKDVSGAVPPEGGGSGGFSISSPSVQSGYGFSLSETDLLDVNGDGLPDQLTYSQQGDDHSVRLNVGGVYGPPVQWPVNPWLVQGGLPVPDVSIVKESIDTSPDYIRVQAQASASIQMAAPAYAGAAGGASVSGGFTFGASRGIVDAVDINGDGLPDHVMKMPRENFLRVQLNLGDRWDVEHRWCLPEWTTDVETDAPLVGDATKVIGSNNALTATESITPSFGLGAMCRIQFVAGIVPLCAKAQASISGGVGAGNSIISFQDVNGDGAPDFLYRRGGGVALAKLNKASKANLLRTVRGPMAGSITLDYARVGNKVDYKGDAKIDMPRNQWALSSVTVASGFGWSSTTTAIYGRDGNVNARGYYDRDERESYGYDYVKTTIVDASTIDPTVDSTIERTFENQEYHKKGRVIDEIMRDGDGNIFQKTHHAYDDLRAPVAPGSRFAPETSTTTYHYEGKTQDEGGFSKSITQGRQWDDGGNLTRLTDEGEPGDATDDVAYCMHYFRGAEGTNIVKMDRAVALPAASAPAGDCSGVTGAAVLRRRVAGYDSTTGFMGSLKLFQRGGTDPESGLAYDGGDAENPTWSFSADGYGNVQSVTDPRAFTVTYTYDSQRNTLVTGVSHPGPVAGQTLTSSATYTSDWGKAATKTDSNGKHSGFLYDFAGRLWAVFAPGEYSGYLTDGTPTLKMVYGQVGLADPWECATTHHVQGSASEAPDTATVMFVDGLGRTLQTKRRMTRDLGEDAGPELGVSVSGEVVYDVRGRVQSQAQPGWVAGTDHEGDFVAGMNAHPTSFGYDILGRTIEVTRPDGSVTTTQYGFSADGQRFEEQTTDVEGNRREVYKDVRGQVRSVVEHNEVGAGTSPVELKTEYLYDPIGQLTHVFDDKLNETKPTYDTLGQLIQLDNPDTGTIKYQYDRAGNLGAKITPNLGDSQRIVYQHTHGWLTSVNYANKIATVYTYGDGSGAANGLGRIVRVDDESGVEKRTYDAMGHVTSVEKTPAVEQVSNGDLMLRPVCPSSGSSLCRKTYTTSYEFDSLNRMRGMVQPDGESIRYTYDQGGTLDTIANAAGVTYVSHMGYDEFGAKKIVNLGNNVKTTYGYEPVLRRLSTVGTTTEAGSPLQDLWFEYDLVGTVRTFHNRIPAGTGASQTLVVGFGYDDLYQLKHAEGNYSPPVARPDGYQTPDNSGTPWSFLLDMQYDEIGNITHKEQTADPDADHHAYTFAYNYTSSRPHAATSIVDSGGSSPTAGTSSQQFDNDGNLLLASRILRNGQVTGRRMTWDEDDRLKKEEEAPVFGLHCGGLLCKECSLAGNDCSAGTCGYPQVPQTGGQACTTSDQCSKRCASNLSVTCNVPSDCPRSCASDSSLACSSDTDCSVAGSCAIGGGACHGAKDGANCTQGTCSGGTGTCARDQACTATTGDLRCGGVADGLGCGTLGAGCTLSDDSPVYATDTWRCAAKPWLRCDAATSGQACGADGPCVQATGYCAGSHARGCDLSGGGTMAACPAGLGTCVAGAPAQPWECASGGTPVRSALCDDDSQCTDGATCSAKTVAAREWYGQLQCLPPCVIDTTCTGAYDSGPCGSSPGACVIPTCVGSEGTCGMAGSPQATTFLYDEGGTRTHKRSGGGETVYVSPNFVIDGTMVMKHVFAGDVRIATVSETWSPGSDPDVLNTYYYHSDHLQSTQFITDQEGQVVQHNEYFPTGESWIDKDTILPWKFTGKELDAETGLYYFGARYYDARSSVWESLDPILNKYVGGGPSGGVFTPGNLDLYTHARNNPVSVVDPSGLVGVLIDHNKSQGFVTTGNDTIASIAGKLGVSEKNITNASRLKSDQHGILLPGQGLKLGGLKSSDKKRLDVYQRAAESIGSTKYAPKALSDGRTGYECNYYCQDMGRAAGVNMPNWTAGNFGDPNTKEKGLVPIKAGELLPGDFVGVVGSVRGYTTATGHTGVFGGAVDIIRDGELTEASSRAGGVFLNPSDKGSVLIDSMSRAMGDATGFHRVRD